MPQIRTKTTKPKRDNFCSSCCKHFSKKEHLTRHLRSHTQEKPFPCPECGKGFGRNDTLTRHLRTHRAPNDSLMFMAPVPSETNRRPARPRFDNGIQGISVPSKSQPVFQDRSPPILPAQSTLPFENLPPANVIAPETATESFMTENSPIQASLDPASMNRLFDDIFTNVNFESEISKWISSEDLGTNPSLHNYESSESFSSFKLRDGMIGLDATDVHTYHRADKNLATLPKEDLLRQKWFNFVSVQGSGESTPDDGAERKYIDENFKKGLYQQLLPSAPDQSLPSADFLNLCLQMFLNRFNPILPVIHLPTFRLSSNKPLLLMAMCTLGTLFLGSPQANSMGQKMLDRLHKASLASWEKYVSRGPDTALMVIQAAFLGHTYAMLSGNPKNLLTMQSFHGTIIAWARKGGMFEQCGHAATDKSTRSKDLESKWKSWAKREEQSRATAALYIQDSEYSALFTEDPLLRHTSVQHPSVCSNKSWEAETLQEWIIATPIAHSSMTASPLSMDQSNLSYSSQGADESGAFGAYAKLASVSASISGAKGLATWPTMSSHFEKDLLDFQDNHPQLFKSPDYDRFSLEILWHSAFIQLSADMNRLEICSGRDGFEKSHVHSEYARDWAESTSGVRCALHAALIMRKSENVSLGADVAVHVPRILYWAALVWYCFLKFGQRHAPVCHVSELEFPEISRLGIHSQEFLLEDAWSETQRSTVATSRTLGMLVDLLGRVGHWTLSRKFASLMASLFHAEPDWTAKDHE